MQSVTTTDTSTKQKKTLNSRFSDFLFEYQVIIAVGFGVLGFVFSSLMLTIPNCSPHKGQATTPYGEVVVENKKPIVMQILDERIRLLSDTISKLAGDKDTQRVGVNLLLERDLYVKRQNALLEKARLEGGKEGLSLALYGRYLLPNREAFAQALKSPAWEKSAPVTVSGYAIDTVLAVMAPVSKDVTFKLKQNKTEKVMDFVDRYPRFGLWMVLTIAQMMLWLLLIPLLIGNVIGVAQKYGEKYKVTLRNILMSCIFPLLFMIIFSLILYYLLIDRTVIEDAYFFTGFNSRIIKYAVLGYLVVALCFGTYISLVRKVVVDESEEKLDLRTQQNTVQTRYDYFNKAFDNAFLASSIILSVFVIWTGVMINAVNNLEGPKLYQLIFGSSLLSEDFPYLLGLLHSCILFIFYIPVKLRFDSLNQGTAPDGTAKVKSLFELFSKSLATLLVTVSPLLAGLLQGLFSNLF